MPVDVLIGGESQTLDEYVKLGGQKLLNAYFGKNPDTFRPDVSYEFQLQRRDQNRFQADVAAETILKADNREYKLGVEYRYRVFDIERPTDLALKRTMKRVITLAVPIWWRLEMALTFEHQRARVQADHVYKANRTEVVFKLPIVLKRSFGFFVN